MIISYDPLANSIYVRLSEPEKDSAGHTEVNGDGVIVDLDDRGSPRGYEFLDVRGIGASSDSLPESVQHALKSFMSEDLLHSDVVVRREYS